MRTTLGVGLALCAAAVAGCGSLGTKPPFTGPEKGGAPWTEVSTEHFTLRTDLPADEARSAASSFETFFASLADVGFASESRPKLHLNVVYFRREEAYQALEGKNTGAMFDRAGLHDFERTPLVILQGNLVQRTKAVIQHELTHLFVYYNYPQAPLWLNEGLAGFYETLDVNDGTATVGRLSDAQHFWRGPWKWQRNPQGITTLIPVTEAPPVAQLLDMAPSAFYADRDVNREVEEGRVELRRVATNYAGVAALVRMFVTDPAYVEDFSAYLQRLHAGEKSGPAWAATVGGRGVAQIDADYRASLVTREASVLKTKYTPPAVTVDAPRTMTNAQVHVLWAALQNWTTDDGLARAARDLEQARALDAAEPNLAVVRASFAMRARNPIEASAVLTEALAARPNDPRLLNAMGWATFSRLVDESPQLTSDRVLPALQPIADRLAPIASTSAELDLLAHYAAFKPSADALAYEKRAIDVNPSCSSCLAWAAQVYAMKGQFHDAIDTATMAIQLLPDGARAPGLEKAIAAYRDHIAKSVAKARSTVTTPGAPADTAADAPHVTP